MESRKEQLLWIQGTLNEIIKVLEIVYIVTGFVKKTIRFNTVVGKL